MVAMDLQWRVKWIREWVELGRRENLTYVELSRRSGLCPKTFARWSRTFRNERPWEWESAAAPVASQSSARASTESPPRELTSVADQATVAGADRARTQPHVIQIVLAGNRRVVVESSIDVEALARIIAAVEAC